MAVVASGDIWKIKLICTQGSQLGYNIRYYRVPTVAGIAPTQDELLLAMYNEFKDLYLPLLSGVASFVGVSASRVYPLLGQTAEYAYTNPEGGSAAGDPLPSQTSGLITLRTDAKGPKGRGRAYIPFPAEGSNGPDGHPTDAYRDLLVALGLKMASAITVGAAPNTSTWQPIIYNPLLGGVYYDIQTHTARQRWATQRRRGDFGQPNILYT